jgi:hypothetical protein
MATMSPRRTHSPDGSFFPFFGIPFVAIGLYLIFGRFFVDSRIRARTYYGVTNERIIIITGLVSQQIKSLQLRTLTDVSLTQRSDGSGTIAFGQPLTAFATTGGGWPGGGRFAPPAFEMIERAKEVYDTIRIAQKSAA